MRFLPRLAARPHLASLFAGCALLLGSTRLHAAPEAVILPDEQTLSQMEQRAAQASLRDQAFLYTELVHTMTEIAGHQMLLGDTEQASASLKRMAKYADMIHLGLTNDAKRLKNAEMLMHQTTFHPLRLPPRHLRRRSRNPPDRPQTAQQSRRRAHDAGLQALTPCLSTPLLKAPPPGPEQTAAKTPAQEMLSSRPKASQSGATLERTASLPKLPAQRALSSLCRSATVLLALLFLAPPLHAQRDEPMSDAEVEQLRESAYVPADRIAVFIEFLDTRAKRIQEIVAKPRRPGREDDLHDLLEQFTAITDELNDNLDDYAPRHADLRKQLPKLLQATDRWSTALRTPADNETYNVSRSLALEGVPRRARRSR